MALATEEVDLELVAILLSQSSECWDCRLVPPHLDFLLACTDKALSLSLMLLLSSNTISVHLHIASEDGSVLH